MLKRILPIIKAIVSIALVIFILSKVDVSKLLTALSSINAVFFSLALLSHFVAIPIAAYMLKLSLYVNNINLNLKPLMGINLIGSFFNNFLPTAIGGDIAKVYYISSYSKNNLVSIITVLFNRMVGFFCLLVLGVVGLIFGYGIVNDISIAIAVIGLLFLFLLLLFFIWDKNIMGRFKYITKIVSMIDKREIIKKSYENFNKYKQHKKEVLFIFLLSFLIQLIVMLYYYLIILSLNLKVPIFYLLMVVPLITIIEVLPLSVGGIGVRESATFYFFTKIGIEPHSAVLIGFINYILRVLLSFVGGIIFMFRRNKVRT
ncbi:flippase-like domain-containing protein [Candidatus Woesearchaeota archaeon]|nr:flippase-like domain-containing protein [Candidatus Woesearchaeota archaeon]